jgi:hypothetical protein
MVSGNKIIWFEAGIKYFGEYHQMISDTVCGIHLREYISKSGNRLTYCKSIWVNLNEIEIDKEYYRDLKLNKLINEQHIKNNT